MDERTRLEKNPCIDGALNHYDSTGTGFSLPSLFPFERELAKMNTPTATAQSLQPR